MKHTNTAELDAIKDAEEIEREQDAGLWPVKAIVAPYTAPDGSIHQSKADYREDFEECGGPYRLVYEGGHPSSAFPLGRHRIRALGGRYFLDKYCSEDGWETHCEIPARTDAIAKAIVAAMEDELEWDTLHKIATCGDFVLTREYIGMGVSLHFIYQISTREFVRVPEFSGRIDDEEPTIEEYIAKLEELGNR